MGRNIRCFFLVRSQKLRKETIAM